MPAYTTKARVHNSSCVHHSTRVHADACAHFTSRMQHSVWRLFAPQRFCAPPKSRWDPNMENPKGARTYRIRYVT
eukprot:8486825-Pyramimonas_sp.AAC.1